MGETCERHTTRSGRQVSGTAKDKAWDIYGYTTQFALKDIPPGRYALRVEAQVRGNVGDAKPVSRETLITVVP